MNSIRITSIKHQGELKLQIFFNDGLSGILDFTNLLTGRVFSTLKQNSKFSSAVVKYGTVVWDGDIDIAPEYLHSKMIEQGHFIKHSDIHRDMIFSTP